MVDSEARQNQTPARFQFDGKSVLVTGAAGGIGAAVCKLFSGAGARVIAQDLNEELLRDALGEEVDGSILIAGNLLDRDFCDTLPLKASTLSGSLDIVVNNAGIMRRGTALDTSDDDWQQTMAVNVDAVFRICRSAIRQMQNQSKGGSIVNVSSCWGLYPGPDHVAYCTSKAAVAAMTKCMARDHARDQIRINAVCPNEVNTKMLRSGFEIRGLDPQSALAQLGESVPLGRIAEPEDIAETIAYLASDSAAYICGACIEVNGAKPVS